MNHLQIELLRDTRANGVRASRIRSFAVAVAIGFIAVLSYPDTALSLIAYR